MATTDNAADVKKICNSAVNLIDDNPLGVVFRFLLTTQKEPDVWARKPTNAPSSKTRKKKTGRAESSTLPAPSSISTIPYSTKLSRNDR
nr:hypothetical protein [uncultured Desulfuromonas sp.]